MKLKKLFAVCTAFVMISSMFTGCGSKNDDSSEEKDAVTTAAEEKPEKKLIAIS